MILTISGNPGSGKSTIAKILVKKLKAERVYAGGMLREMAKERNLKIEELLKLAEKHTEIDSEVDIRVRDRARKLEKSGKVVIVEGRVHFHIIPESLKVYIKVDEEEGARRIWKDLQDKEKNKERNQEAAKSIEEVIKKNKFREETDAKRYVHLYGVDHRDPKNYDLLINTTEITAEEAAEKIIQFVKKRR